MDQPPLTQAPPPLLPVWETVKKSYSLAWYYRWEFLRISRYWMLGLFLVVSYNSWISWPSMKEIVCNNAPDLIKLQQSGNAHDNHISNILMWFILVLSVFVTASIAVAWHRLILRNKRIKDALYLRHDKVVLNYFMFGVGLFFFMFSPLIIVWLMPDPGTTTKSSGFVALIAIIIGFTATFVITMRLWIMLPARALERNDVTLGVIWRNTQWNFWRIFWGYFLCSLPDVLPSFLRSAGCGSNIAGPAMDALSYLIGIIVTVPIGLSFLSLCYQHFIENEHQVECPALQDISRFPLKTVIFTLLALGAYGLYQFGSKMVYIIVQVPTDYQKLDEACTGTGSPSDIINACSFVIESDKANIDDFTSRAIAEENTGQLEKAIDDMSQALKLKPDSYSNYFQRGMFYLEDGKYNAALLDFKHDSVMETPEQYNNILRGLLLLHQGKAQFYTVDPVPAVEDFAQAVHKNPGNPYGIIWLHIARLRTSQSDQREFAKNISVWQAQMHRGSPSTSPPAVNWPLPLFDLYQDKTTFEDVLRQASNSEEKCDAYFYGAELFLTRHETAKAHDLFSSAENVCSVTAPEKAFAKSELEAIKVP